METLTAPSSMSERERISRIHALFKNMFPTNETIFRRKIRKLVSTLPEDIAVFTEKLLVLMKKHNFSLCAHENLHIICEGFGPYCATNLSPDEHRMVYFRNLVDEWRCSGIELTDFCSINKYEEEFNFINL